MCLWSAAACYGALLMAAATTRGPGDSWLVGARSPLTRRLSRKGIGRSGCSAAHSGPTRFKGGVGRGGDSPFGASSLIHHPSGFGFISQSLPRCPSPPPSPSLVIVAPESAEVLRTFPKRNLGLRSTRPVSLQQSSDRRSETMEAESPRYEMCL
ncbi:hypothetical protein B0T16DRAFT_228562 [Cercophora newfieldiana]|uniref:Secreted protein n=1 Tax=Cercophora newfieldiana TaxID=92897 RepID=A0AA39XR37_9PEZI|nr:hypothetical protein B0T16DRAFT_228562 [Cercophora newfieldiana]